MRMDSTAPLSAYEVVNTWSEERLNRILWDYGEERYARRISAAILAAREKAKQPKVRIDLSRLDAIRKDAAVTRDRLIVEDPAEEMSPQADISSKPAAAISMPAGRPQDPEDSKPSAGAVSALTPQQRQFLTLLLQGADAVGYARANHLMLSALTDSINEAFYDEIGDSILEMDGEAPELIEDYRDDVKELLS